jgi:hypothetical protein
MERNKMGTMNFSKLKNGVAKVVVVFGQQQSFNNGERDRPPNI